MPLQNRSFGAALAVAGLVAGCAATTQSPPALEAAAGEAAPAPAGQTYTLTKEEQGLDCKRITGRMQVRILQIRDYRSENKTTLVSRGIQSATTSVVGGSAEGTDPDGRYARDRAVLDAYNRQLAAKGCKTFDLEAELRPKPVTATPTPVAKAKPDAAQKSQ